MRSAQAAEGILVGGRTRYGADGMVFDHFKDGLIKLGVGIGGHG